MAEYKLRVLDGTCKGYTVSVIAEDVKHRDDVYEFFLYDEEDKYQVIAWYPKSKTVIEEIVR